MNLGKDGFQFATASLVPGLLQTFDRLEVAEFSANSLVMAASIGPLKPMGDEEIDELRRVFKVGR